MPEKEKIILPPKYYLDYFSYLIEFIQAGSGHCLSEADLGFIETFKNLSEDAQCLMIRMANRKGEYFRLDKLLYEEISNTPAAAEELVEVEIATLDPPDDYLLFTLFTKKELHDLFPERNLKSKYKEEVLIELAEESTPDEFMELKGRHTLIQFLQQEQVEYFKLLFFGHYHGMMTEFVIRDIGNVKLESLEHHEFTPWFTSREEAVAVFQLSKWDHTIKKAMQLLLPEDILELILPVNWSDFLTHPKSRKAGDKLMLRLGEYFEKNGLLTDALNYYSLARKHPARERRIRILEKLGEEHEAREIAEVAFEHPYNATEKIFTKDFLSKKSVRNYRSTTARIKNSPEISVEYDPDTRVETQALMYYQEQGFDGIHAENYLWRGLFGLFFWDELFDHNQQSFHHPLQRMPSDLYNEAFYSNRKEVLLEKMTKFRTRKSLFNYLAQVHATKQGINNPLVGWHQSLLPSIEQCIAHLPLKAIKNVLLEMAKNVKDNSTGFPDLFIWTDDSYHFFEIKSPNDHLSAQQLFWLDFFSEQHINSNILRVNFK